MGGSFDRPFFMPIMGNCHFTYSINTTGTLNMDWKKLAIAGGILYAAYKFSGNNLIKGAAVSVGAVILAKQTPFVKDVI